MAKQIDQSRNGVRVIVNRQINGSTVEASCHCYGHPLRTHSNPRCQNIGGGAHWLREKINRAKEQR